MGRLMTATSMLGVMMKGDNESVTVNLHGDGPMGTIVAVANHGDVKVCADDARVELPLRADGKLDVGGAVTRHANGALEVHRSRRNGSGLIKAENIDAGEHFDAIELLDENALPRKPCSRDDENR